MSNDVLNKITFRMLVDDWIETKKARIKISTRSKYLAVYYKHIDPVIGNMKLTEITSELMDRLLINLFDKENVSGSLFNMVRYVLNSILRYGNQEGYFCNLAVTVESARQNTSSVQILSDGQIRQIGGMFTESFDPTYLGIVLSLCTGMRLGEICALKREDIDMENDIVHVRRTVQRVPDQSGRSVLTIGKPKSPTSYRDIPIIPHLSLLLKKYGVDRLSFENYVLSNREVPYEPRTLQYGFTRFFQKCNITELHFHCLRHTFATRCIRAGMDMKTLSEILGHANVGITMNIYVHSDLTEKKLQMKLFEEKLIENLS